jgi:uncharacterized surface protein with fasciclin (FAS1) repeats
MKKAIFYQSRKSSAIIFALVFFTGLSLSSCSEEEVIESINTGDESLDIVNVLRSFDNGSSAVNPSFNTLLAALEQAGLSAAVSSGQLTLFAPTDAAFGELGLNAGNIASVPDLTDILLYHVVDGRVLSSQLSNRFVQTLNGPAIEVVIADGVKINNAMVTRADIKSNNGIIHAIDQVILPPTENLVGLAQSLDPEFSLLIAAVTKANLAGVLSEGGVFTVFAPTNNAFLALLEELKLSSLDDIPMGLLTEVLLYHVVEGRVYSSDLENGSVTTLNGTFNINLNNLKITDSNNREASLIPSLLNVQATNGVVHVIDKVILP